MQGGVFHRENAIVLPAALAAAAVALWGCAHLACLSRDGTHYIAFAQQLAQDPVFYLRAHRSQPGYSATMLAAYALMPSAWRGDPIQGWVRVGQAAAAIGYVACVPLLFVFARRLFDARVAAVCAMLAAIWPQAAQLGGDVLSDMPHLALYLAAVLAADAGLRGTRGGVLFAAGALSGIAYLFRQEALGVPAAVVVALWWPRSSPSRRRSAVATGLLALGFALPVTPYALATGELLHKKSLHELFLGPASGPSAGEPRRASVPHESGSRGSSGVVTAGDSSAAIASSSRVTQALYMLDGWGRSGRYVYSALALAALLTGAAWSAQRRAARFTLLLLTLHCAAVGLRGASFGVVSTRYMLIPAALTLPWSAAGLCTIVDAVLRRRPHWSRRAVWAFAWAVVAAIPLTYALRPINAMDGYLRVAGEFLRGAARPGDAVLGEHRASQTIYYSGCKWNQWPGEGWPMETILSHADEAGARWYVHFDGSRGDARRDDATVAAMLSQPRWPHARLAYRAGPPGRSIRIVLLRP